MSTKPYKERSLLFKTGFSLLQIVTICFTVGFSYPGWTSFVDGLWLCNGGDTWYSNVNTSSPGTLQAVRVLECIALTCLWLSVIVEIAQDFRKTSSPPTNSIAVECLSGVGGIAGVIGGIIFAADAPRVQCGWLEIAIDALTIGTDGSSVLDFYLLGWAFYMATLSSGLACICAILIAIARRYKDSVGRSPSSNGPQGVLPPNPYPYGQQNPRYSYAGQQTYGQAWTVQPHQQHAYPIANPLNAPLPQTSDGGRGAQAIQMQDMTQPRGSMLNANPSNANGPSTSSIPVYYVMNQGTLVPVYSESPVGVPAINEGADRVKHYWADRSRSQDGRSLDFQRPNDGGFSRGDLGQASHLPRFHRNSFHY